MTGFLGSTPFFIKLIVAIAVDLLSAGVGILGLTFLPVFFVTHGVTATTIAILQLTIIWLFYGFRFMPFLFVAGAEPFVPVLNILPIMTMCTVIVGYRTGWRH